MRRPVTRILLRRMMLFVALAAANVAGWRATWEQFQRYRAWRALKPAPKAPFSPVVEYSGRVPEPPRIRYEIMTNKLHEYYPDGSIYRTQLFYNFDTHKSFRGERRRDRAPSLFKTAAPLPTAPRPFPVEFWAALRSSTQAALAAAITAVVLAAPFVARFLRAPDHGAEGTPGARGRVRPWRLAAVAALVALNIAGVLVSRARLYGPPVPWRRLPPPGPYARWCLLGARDDDGLGAHLHYYGNGAIEFRSDFRSDPVTDRVTQRPDWPNHPFMPQPSDAEELWRIMTPAAASLTITVVFLAVSVVWHAFRRARSRRRPTPAPPRDSA